MIAVTVAISLAVAAQPAVGAAAPPAARVDGEPISFAEVDAATNGRAAALAADLVATAEAIVGEIVSEPSGDLDLSLPTGDELAQPLDPNRIVARSARGSVTAGALESRGALRLYWLRGELARVRRRALDELVEARLLVNEARRRGVAVEALVEAEPVEPADLEALAAAEKAAGRAAPNPARVRPLLEARARHRAREALVAKLRDEAEAEILLREIAPPRLTVSSRAAPSLGPAGGPEVLLFADYRSPAARRMQRDIDRLRTLRPDVRVVLRDFVLESDARGTEAALLVRCADRFGRVDAMRAALLARDPPAVGESWRHGSSRERLAEILGVGAASLDACLASPDLARAVRDDSNEIRAVGFEKPPAMLVAGRPFAGVQTAETLAGALPPKRPLAR